MRIQVNGESHHIIEFREFGSEITEVKFLDDDDEEEAHDIVYNDYNSEFEEDKTMEEMQRE